MAITQLESGGIKNDAVIASKIAEDAIAISDLAASGTPSSTNFLCGNNTWMGIGGDLPVDYNDNIKARWGTGNDLQIFHDASNSVIRNLTGDLYLETSAGSADDIYIKSVDDIWLKPQDGESGIDIHGNGNVKLYYDSSRKLETTTTGIYVDSTIRAGTTTGSVSGGNALIMSGSAGSRVKLCRDAAGVGNGDGLELIMGADNTTYLWNRENTDLLIGTNGSERLRVDAAGNLNLGRGAAASTEYGRNFQIHDTGTSGATLHLTNSNTGPGNSDGFHLVQQGSHLYHWLRETGDQVFATGGTERLRVKSGGDVNIVTGNLQIGGTNVINSGRALYNLESLKLADTKKAIFGSGDDLQIWHDGSHSYISDEGSGQLRIRSDSNIWLEHGTENMIVAKGDNAVELYYDNSKKFETSSTGAKWHGWLYCDDSDQIRFGNGGDLQIYHDGSHSYIQNGGTGSLYIRSNNVIAFLDDSGDEMLAKFVDNGRCELYFDNSKKLETTSTGVTISGDFLLDNSTNANRDVFFDESANLMRFKDHVNVSFGDGDDLIVYSDGDYGNIRANTNDLFIRSNSANDRAIAVRSGAQVELYYDDAKKLETTSSGVTVTGGIIAGGLTYPTSDGSNGQVLTTNGSGTLSFSTVSGGGGGGASGTDYNDNVKVRFGTGNDFSIYHDGTNSIQFFDAQVGSVKFRTDIGNSARNNIVLGQGVELYHLNSKKLNTHADGIEILGKVYMADSKTIELGNSQDLKIYHDGSNGYNRIDAVNGNLYLRVNSTENAFKGTPNGNVEICYDGTKKFETTSAGGTVTGTLTASGTGGGAAALGSHLDLGDSQKVRLGASDDLQLYHDGGNSFVADTGTGSLLIQSDAVNLGSTSGEYYFRGFENGSAYLRYDNSTKLETVSGGVTVTGAINVDGGIQVTGGSLDINEKIKHIGDLDTFVSFPAANTVGITTGNSERVRIDSSGSLLINSTSNNDASNAGQTPVLYANGYSNLGGLRVKGGDTGNTIYKQSGDLCIVTGDAGAITLRAKNETSVDCNPDGSVELYYDNSKKFETVSGGVKVSGDLEVTGQIDVLDNVQLRMGHSDDLIIYHDGNHSYILDNGTGELRLRGNVIKFNNNGDTETMISATENSEVLLYHNNSQRLGTTSTGLKFRGSSSGFYGVMETNDGNNRGYLHANSSEQVGLLDDQQHWLLNGTKNGAANLYYDNSKKLETSSAGGTLHGTWTGAGKILQVVSTVKTDTASTTSSSWSAVSGLSATITPSSSSSKIYIMVTLTASSNAGVNAGGAFRIYKGGSHLSASSGDGASNRITSFGQATSGHSQAWKVHNVAYNYLDSPSTTSATTYAIYWRAEHSSGSWLGRGYSDNDNTDRVRTPSTITLMEVSA